MAPQTGGIETRPGMLGTKWPNLVIERDAEKGNEFRVQCEVILTDAEAQDIADLLMAPTRSKENLEKALKLVEPRVDKEARKTFRDMVRLGFKGQPEYEP